MIKLARHNLHYLAGGIVCMIVSTALGGVQFSAIIPLADRIFTNKAIILPEGMPQFLIDLAQRFNAIDRSALFYGIIIAIPVFTLVQGMFSYLQALLMNVVAQKTVADVRGDIFLKYQELSLDFYSQKRQGELMARITHDAGFIGHAISFALTDLIYQSLQAVMFTVIAFTISWKTVLFILLIFPFNALMIRTIGKTIKKQSLQSQESMADLNSILVETNQGVSIVKAFSRESHEILRFGQANQRFYKATIKSIRRNLIMSPVTTFLMAVSIAVVFWVAGRHVMEGKMSFGVFALFLTSLLSIYRPINKLIAVYGINQQALASSKRIYDILDWAPKIVDAPDAVECRPPRKMIRFENVSFKYDKKEEQWIIENLSHDFEIGKTTALVGPTGCGKTTVINMILRFYDTDRGRILCDDQDIKTVTTGSLRNHIGLVTQDMILFNETIRANLQYGKLDVTDTEIYAAARQALAFDFISKMPQGLDTVIGDRGFKLSGGQKQRLCIARAILKNPRILLLDEATSALDAESEFLVQQALDNLMKNRTVIVIAHRLSTIRHADCILVMEGGKIIQKGIHDELLKTSELYARLASYHFNQ
jgi:subfamily B ATP-binding cassette protein MsbA